MNLYLNSAGIISGAGNSTTGIKDNTGHSTAFAAQEPDYTDQIPPMQLRRMSKAVRMGIGAANFCLQSSGVEKADAISVGTAMGCLQDTETFLGKLVEQNEQMLTPTAFIQSTHNTVAGQIALVTGCNGHNLTYVQRGHSFEHAMLNTYLYLSEHPSEKVLVGGIDELTANSISVMTKAGVYNNTIQAGEGATFLLATKEPLKEGSLHVNAIDTFTTKDGEIALNRLQRFIDANHIEKPDLVLSGKYNDTNTNVLYDAAHAKFPGIPVIAFKELCGEYATSGAFALGLLSQLVSGHYCAPHFSIFSKKPAKVLLVNNYLHYISYWYIEV